MWPHVALAVSDRVRKLDWSKIKTALYLSGLRIKRSPNHSSNQAHWLYKLDGTYWASTGWATIFGGPLTTELMLKIISKSELGL